MHANRALINHIKHRDRRRGEIQGTILAHIRQRESEVIVAIGANFDVVKPTSILAKFVRSQIAIFPNVRSKLVASPMLCMSRFALRKAWIDSAYRSR